MTTYQATYKCRLCGKIVGREMTGKTMISWLRQDLKRGWRNETKV